MRPLLFTTIPPEDEGVPLDPRDGGDRRIGAIRSWHQAGFDPVSINLDREAGRHPGFREALRACGVESIVRPPSRGTATDRACAVVDALAAIGERAGTAPFLILNADIRIATGGDDVAADVARLDAREFLLAGRTEEGFDRDGCPHESVFANGFDGVAMAGGMVSCVLPFLAPALAFGRPWWDHYLPMALIATGSRPRRLDPGLFRHRAHPSRWSKSQYGAIGREAFARFREEAERLPDRSAIRAWLEATGSGIVPGYVPAPLGPLFRRVALHPAAPDLLASRVLTRVAAANLRLIGPSSRARPLLHEPSHSVA